MPPRGIRLAAPQSPGISSPPPAPVQQQNQHQSNNNNNEEEDDFSPSQIPPPEGSPPPPSPPSNSNNQNNRQNNQQQQQQPYDAHHRKRSDVTMKAEYEMELERKHRLNVQHHQNPRTANLDGTGSERLAFGHHHINRPGALFSGEEDQSEEDQLEIARQALRAAQIRQKQSEVDVRRAKNDLERTRNHGGGENSFYYSENSGTVRAATPNKSDVHIRKLDPRRLQENAKMKREQLEAEKQAARKQKQDAIYRGPEVAQVSAAANDLKVETSKICEETIAAMELAISQLREEKDQLMIRLERTERAMNDDISRAEGELSWIDFASAEAKKLIDEANKAKEMKARDDEMKRQKKAMMSENNRPTWK